MMSLRAFPAILLALLLILTGHSVGAMRGMSDPAQSMVLCTGTGPVTVYVDENGVPTKRPHVCPDCVINLLDGLAPVSALPALTLGASNLHYLSVPTHVASLSTVFASARGPPAMF